MGDVGRGGEFDVVVMMCGRPGCAEEKEWDWECWCIEWEGVVGAAVVRLRFRGTLLWTARSEDDAGCDPVLGRLWARGGSGEGARLVSSKL